MKKRIMFIGPHPDDVELGAGGLILRLKKKGHKVYIVDLTTGEPTPFGNEKRREKETLEANKILGIDKRFNLGFKNRYLFDGKDVRIKLAEKIRELKIEVMFVPYFKDAHPDHIAASHISVAARFYAKFRKSGMSGRPNYPEKLFYFFCSHRKIVPDFDFLVDISKFFERKMEAIKKYKSQVLINRKNRELLTYVRISNSYFGKLIEKEFAEPVKCFETIDIDYIKELF